MCEYAGYAPTAQAIFFAGSFIGGLFFGWMADRFGRVPALVGKKFYLAMFGWTLHGSGYPGYVGTR